MTQPWRIHGDDLLLSIRLTPRSAREAIGGIWRDAHGAAWLCASVRAVPEKGRANAALIDLLSKSILIPPSSISLESGEVSRLKRVRMAAVGDRIVAQLQDLAGEA